MLPLVPRSVPGMMLALLAVATLPVTTPPPNKVCPAPKVNDTADTSKIAPLLTVKLVLANEAVLPSFNLPPLTVVLPV